eukprot:scaffold2941_cov146-Skeletonema_marinoi.AAC.8
MNIPVADEEKNVFNHTGTAKQRHWADDKAAVLACAWKCPKLPLDDNVNHSYWASNPATRQLCLSSVEINPFE